MSSNQVAKMSPWLFGIAAMIDTTLNDYKVDTVSELLIEIWYWMLYAAYMRLECSDNDVAFRIGAGLTQGADI